MYEHQGSVVPQCDHLGDVRQPRAEPFEITDAVAESEEYFGEQGDRLQMMLNFPVNQRLWYALATGDIEPLKWAINETRKRAAARAVRSVPAQPR